MPAIRNQALTSRIFFVKQQFTELNKKVVSPNLPGPFFFTGEPEGRTLKEGEEAKLNCTFDREPTGLKYYWYKYGNDDIEGSLLQVFSTTT